ncbi:MAG TPA: thioredoxin family protein [Candidatus Nanoarchaeia archaeon]|nr:thioredoxin family protein [Candidatus Nanoarchaeia archaeon]
MDEQSEQHAGQLSRAERKRMRRMAGQEERSAERDAAQQKRNRKIFVFSVIGLLAVAGIWYAIAQSAGGPGKYDAFAQCLTEKEVSMGGADWCPHCQTQKKMFGKSFQFVEYHDCDRDPAWCGRNAVRSYPTWIVGGKQYTGVQQLSDLSALSGCPLAA